MLQTIANGLFLLLTRLCALSLAGCMALLLAAAALEGTKDAAAQFPGAGTVQSLAAAAQAPFLAALKARVPTEVGGVDYARWMVFAGLMALWAVALAQSSRLKYHRWRRAEELKAAERQRQLEAERAERTREHKENLARMEREAAERADREAVERGRRAAELEAQRREMEALRARESARIAQESRLAAEAALREAEEERLAAAKAAAQSPAPVPAPAPVTLSGGVTKERSREELLELMAQAKKQLEKQKRSLSFLAIDVVNSTGMKVGEDPAIAARDFKHYRKLVEKAIADNNGLKAAWTPDGVMICFPTAEAAVAAAKQVIKDLDHFNRHVKAMRHDFKVRCGINTGTVLFDDTVPMEEMSDRSIDIAGHMQKYADANAIYVGRHVIEEMRSAADFQPASKQVDGCDVYSWHARSN